MSFESAMAAAGATPTPTPGATQATDAPKSADAALTQALDAGASGTPPPATADTPAEAAAPKESASQTFQALAKERKRVLELQKQIKERDTAFEDMKKRLADLEGKPTAKPKDPIAALQAAGYSYQDASEFVLNNSQLTPEQQVKAVRDEIAALRAQAEEEKKQAEAERKRQAEEAQSQRVTEFKEEIADFVGSNGDTYELLSQEDPTEVQGLIYNLIAQAYAQSVEAAKESGDKPRILSVKEGADLAEKYYEERLEKFYRTKKMQSRFAPKAPEAEVKAAQVPSASKTLSQAGAAGSAGTRPPAKSEAERMQRAMEALERMGR